MLLNANDFYVKCFVSKCNYDKVVAIDMLSVNQPRL